MSSHGAAGGRTIVPWTVDEAAAPGCEANGLRARLARFEFDVETRMASRLNRALGRRPSSAPYVSGDGFRRLATHLFEGAAPAMAHAVRAGDVVLCETHHLPQFAREVLPMISEPFVLLSHNSDESVSGKLAEIADNRFVSAWFAQNNLLHHPRIVSIPIGIENAHHHKHGIVRDFDRLRGRRARQIPRILYGFTISTNFGERDPAAQALQRCAAADWVNLDARRYRETVRRYMFVASPEGNGADCHRTWEALYLGAIPIVRPSPLFAGFPGLPLLTLNDWGEVVGFGEGALGKLFASKRGKLDGCPYLWMPYWEALVSAAREKAVRG